MKEKVQVVKMCYGALEAYFLSGFSMRATRVTRHSEGQQDARSKTIKNKKIKKDAKGTWHARVV